MESYDQLLSITKIWPESLSLAARQLDVLSEFI